MLKKRRRNTTIHPHTFTWAADGKKTQPQTRNFQFEVVFMRKKPVLPRGAYVQQRGKHVEGRPRSLESPVSRGEATFIAGASQWRGIHVQQRGQYMEERSCVVAARPQFMKSL